jgi:hypothetical protein
MGSTLLTLAHGTLKELLRHVAISGTAQLAVQQPAAGRIRCNCWQQMTTQMETVLFVICIAVTGTPEVQG